MAIDNILESYLVRLSMKGPSAAEQREAEKAFSALAEAVAVVVPAITAAGVSIVAITDKIADGLSKLYYEAQKTGATVRELDAAGKAMVQSGTTLEKFHADFNKFAEKLRYFPQYKDILKKQVGLTDEDFKDVQTTHSAYLKVLAERRKHGDMSIGLMATFDTDEDVILARGRATYDPYFQKQMERDKGLDEQATKAVALVRSLNDFGNALEAVGRKAAAALFDKYGIVLDDMTKWVDDHSDEIVDAVTETVNQLVLAWKDIEPIAVPAVHLIGVGLDHVTLALDRLIGSPDGQHGGLHAVRYLLDALAVYIAGKWALKLLGLLSIGRLLIPFLRTLGPAGVAAAGAYEFFEHVPKAEGDTVSDQVYGLDHPGWHPGMPKEKTRAQKEHDGVATPNEAVATPDSAAPSDSSNFQNNPAMGRPNFKKGAPLDLVTWTTKGGIRVTSDREAAPHMQGFLEDLEAAGAPLEQSGVASYVNRRQASGAESMHSHGGAIDVMSTGRNLLTPAMQRWVDAHPNELHAAELRNRMLAGRDFRNPDMGHWEWGGAANPPVAVDKKDAPVSTPPKPESKLQLPSDLHSRLAALTDRRPIKSQWSRTNNIGTRKQTTNIQLASTDPHTAASEIARHMKGIHAGTLRSLDRLA